MKISTKGRYALRLMTDIAAHDSDGYVSLKDVAARQGISMKYSEQIAGLLAKAGLLHSGRGLREATGWPNGRRTTPWAAFCG